jgi:hypothetical protein
MELHLGDATLPRLAAVGVFPIDPFAVHSWLVRNSPI